MALPGGCAYARDDWLCRWGGLPGGVERLGRVTRASRGSPMRCLLHIGLLASGCAAYNGYSVGEVPSTYQEAAPVRRLNEPSDSCGELVPVAVDECPDDLTLIFLATCDVVACGELCEGDGECGTDGELDNCAGGYDVYRKYCGAVTLAPTADPSPRPTFAPTTPAPTVTPKPTTEPTPMPSSTPTLTPVPTFAFQCDNAMCTENGYNDGTSDDCCAESPGCQDGSTPVKKDGHKCRAGREILSGSMYNEEVIWGDLFTCCTGFRIPTDEELTASGFAWEDHKNHKKDSEGGGGDGWGMHFLIILCVLLGICVIAAVAIVVGVGYCGCCEPTAPKPRTARASARAVELVPTAHAVEVPAAAGVV